MIATSSGAQAQAIEEQYAQAAQEARELMVKDQYSAVVAKLAPWIERFPGRAELRQGMGLAHYHLGNYREAAQHLSAAQKVLPADSPGWEQSVRFLGMAYYFERLWEEALPWLQHAVGRKPDDEELRHALATCYLHTHNLDETRQAYAELYGIEADSPSAFLLAAHVMYQGEYGLDAEKLLLQATERWPNWSEGSYYLGAVSMIKGDYPAAVRHLEKEVRARPSNFGAWHYLGEAHLVLGQSSEAEKALRRAIWLNDQSIKSYVLLAEVHLSREQYGFAEEALRRALQIEPRHYRANFLLARVYQKTERPELAKKQIEAAEKLRPK